MERGGDLEKDEPGAGSLAGRQRGEKVGFSPERFQPLPRASWVARWLIFSANLTGFKITYKGMFSDVSVREF